MSDIGFKPTASRVLVELVVSVEVAGYSPGWSIQEAVEDACRSATGRLKKVLSEESSIRILSARAARVVSDAATKHGSNGKLEDAS